jgi:hypothetical protein
VEDLRRKRLSSGSQRPVRGNHDAGQPVPVPLGAGRCAGLAPVWTGPLRPSALAMQSSRFAGAILRVAVPPPGLSKHTHAPAEIHCRGERRLMRHVMALGIALLSLLGFAPTAAAQGTRQCGAIVFTPRSDDSVSRITARRMSCRAARRELRATARGGTLEDRGWRCRMVSGSSGGMEGAGRFRCRRGGQALAFNIP